ncbi:hypothetical protein FRC09_017138 [Ceratobasidium sp. 395]|nr:hypothetical protein FRC09_017138 [Ceratobasidium sp. 395]
MPLRTTTTHDNHALRPTKLACLPPAFRPMPPHDFARCWLVLAVVIALPPLAPLARNGVSCATPMLSGAFGKPPVVLRTRRGRSSRLDSVERDDYRTYAEPWRVFLAYMLISSKQTMTGSQNRLTYAQKLEVIGLYKQHRGQMSTDELLLLLHRKGYTTICAQTVRRYVRNEDSIRPHVNANTANGTALRKARVAHSDLEQ